MTKMKQEQSLNQDQASIKEVIFHLDDGGVLTSSPLRSMVPRLDIPI